MPIIQSNNQNLYVALITFLAPDSSLLVKLNMVDLNRQGKMYSQGMAPVYRILPGKIKWDRIQDKPIHNVSNVKIYLKLNVK